MKNNNLKLKKICVIAAGLTAVYYSLDRIAKKYAEKSEIDDDNQYLTKIKKDDEEENIYESKVKPKIDKAISFVALVALSPLFAMISIAIYIDDPGPIFFSQKRVGKNKHYFMLHKFRSMKMSAPHNVPTHQLKNPEQYITRVGKVLRKTSLDEIPQIWDIFRGKMAIVGPRPALWNQEDLIAERDRYNANDVDAGLTGLAQIQGRDSNTIQEKARLDGEYVRHMRRGGVKAFFNDFSLLIRTAFSVLRHDGVIEGGTGAAEGQNKL